MSGLGLTFLRRGNLAHPIAGSGHIKFEDEAIFNILMSKGVSSDGVGITKEDAARITTIGQWFRRNKDITTFDELKYFVNVKSLDYAAFQECTNLRWVNLDNIETFVTGNTFQLSGVTRIVAPKLRDLGGNNSWDNCSSLEYVEDLGEVASFNRSFPNCKNIKVLKFPYTTTFINSTTLYGSKVHTAICYASTPPSIAFSSFLGFTAIYVPDASLDAYKGASGWSNYASKIYPLSEYIEDENL